MKPKPTAPAPLPEAPLPDAPAPEAPLPDERLRPALEALAAVDPDIGAAYRRCGLPPERGREPGFAGLIRIIAGPQVSVQSARPITPRPGPRVSPLAPPAFTKARDNDLRAAPLTP